MKTSKVKTIVYRRKRKIFPLKPNRSVEWGRGGRGGRDNDARQKFLYNVSPIRTFGHTHIMDIDVHFT